MFNLLKIDAFTEREKRKKGAQSNKMMRIKGIYYIFYSIFLMYWTVECTAHMCSLFTVHERYDTRFAYTNATFQKRNPMRTLNDKIGQMRTTEVNLNKK